MIFLDYGKAISKGLIQGVVLDQVDMVMHPVQTIKNVGHLLSNVGYYLGKVAYEYGHLNYLIFTDPEAADKKIQAWQENVCVLANALHEKYQETSGPELAQESTRFVSGILFGSKTTGLLYNVFKKVPGKVAKKAAEVFRVLQEEEQVCIATDGSKIKLQNTNFMDKAKNVGGRVTNTITKMENFFKNTKFGKLLKNKSSKLKGRQYDGQAVYKITTKVDHPELKKGYHFYLDALHKDHLEVFDKAGNFRACLNLDGSRNRLKTLQAANNGNRNIKSLIK